MQLDKNELTTAKHALLNRAVWASARGFFWLSERDFAMIERLDLTPTLTDADVRHLRAVLKRVGGAENEALDRSLGLRR